jgi:hypothetical protein
VTARGSATVALGIGVVAVVAAAASGAAADALADLATPPALIRAFLVALAVVATGWLLRLALLRMEEARTVVGADAVMTTTQLGAMVRGIRFVFLAAAAFSAAIGWLVGHPLPIVIGLVIAGVDLAETSFLPLVASGRGR